MDELLENATATDPDEQGMSYTALEKNHKLLQGDYQVLEHNYSEALSQIDFFEQQLRLLKHKMFGQSSEKTSPEQGILFDSPEADLSDEFTDETGEVASHRRKKKNTVKRNQFPIHWPRREIVHDIDLDSKVDDHGNPLKLIGYDEFEQVSVKPACHEVIIHKRPKYALEVDDGSTEVRQAPPALVPLPKSFATPSLLGDIITSKFVEHLPLHRYEQRCDRLDFALPRGTQARWLIRLCEEGGLLNPLVNLLLDYLRSLSVMHCDETRFKVFNEVNRKNPDSALAYAWMLAGHAEIDGQTVKLAYYHYSPSKSADVIDTLLGDFSGHLVTDGYSGFERAQGIRDGTERAITLCGCWDHARRRFKDAEKGLKKGDKRQALTHQGVALVNKLYRIEREIKEKSPEEKYAHRQEHTVPALQTLKTWLVEKQPKINAKGYLGDAVSYTLNQWEKLERFAHDGALPISNIFCEQQAKKFAVGRKNWMFANTPAGANASCMLYSLAVTACLNQVNPFHYFRYILAAMPSAKTLDDLERLLPWRVDPHTIRDFDEFSLCRSAPRE